MKDEILGYIKKLNSQYYKLILLVGKTGSGKTRMLKYLAASTGRTVLDLNIELSKMLKSIPKNERCLYVQDFLDEILRQTNGRPVFLDNTEILFSSHLQIDPIGTLKNSSRYYPLVAAINGFIDNNRLIYADRNHPDYITYKVDELKCRYYFFRGE
ncbi:MAG: BREX-3 system P-loop-containing protein BrxF [Bacillota bacterium]